MWDVAAKPLSPPPQPVEASVPKGTIAETGGASKAPAKAGGQAWTYTTNYVLDHMQTLPIAVLKNKIIELQLELPEHVVEKSELIQVLADYKARQSTYPHHPGSPTSDWDVVEAPSTSIEPELHLEPSVPIPLPDSESPGWPSAAQGETQSYLGHYFC